MKHDADSASHWWRAGRKGLQLLGSLVSCSFSSVVTGEVPQPLSDRSGAWTLSKEYSDEFDAQALDIRKWTSSVASWGKWSWRSENVRLSDGSLALQMRYEPHMRDGETLHYTSGIVKSVAPKLYGYFEARIRAANKFPGVCPAFWAYRAEREWTEIDFVELTQRKVDPRLVDFNTHVFRHAFLPRFIERHFANGSPWRAPWDPRESFHVYGARWTADEIEWFVDGQSVARAKNMFWHQALDVVLSFGLREPLQNVPSSDGFPTTFYVDYVRVWDAPSDGAKSH